jgi:hypothetical protein
MAGIESKGEKHDDDGSSRFYLTLNSFEIVPAYLLQKKFKKCTSIKLLPSCNTLQKPKQNAEYQIGDWSHDRGYLRRFNFHINES